MFKSSRAKQESFLIEVVQCKIRLFVMYCDNYTQSHARNYFIKFIPFQIVKLLNCAKFFSEIFRIDDIPLQNMSGKFHENRRIMN